MRKANVKDEPRFVHLFGNAYGIASRKGRIVCAFTYKNGLVKLASPDQGMRYWRILRRFAPNQAISLEKAKQMGWA